jgi:hypothetical protein
MLILGGALALDAAPAPARAPAPRRKRISVSLAILPALGADSWTGLFAVLASRRDKIDRPAP